MKLLTKAGRVFDKVVIFLAYVAGLAIVLMVLSIFAEVMSRRFLGYSIAGVVEFNECFILYMTFLGTTWVLRNGRHVRMEMLLDRLNSRNQAGLNCVTSTLAAVVCLIIAWYSAVTTWDVARRGVCRQTMLDFPLGVLVAVIAVGFFLLFIQFVREAHRYLASWKGASLEERGSGPKV